MNPSKSLLKEIQVFLLLLRKKYWDTLNRNTLATTRAQDIAEVLNPDYRPVTDNDVNMFKEKHKFMHSVFDKTLQTDRGKKYSREHEGDYNAQSFYQKLNSFHTESTNARARVSTTLSYITPAKI